MELLTFLERLNGAKKCGAGYTAKCPAHDDKQNSLSISEGDGKILVKCHAGCSFDQIVDSMGIKKSDMRTTELSAPKKISKSKPDSNFNIVKTYDYVDENNKLLYQVVRLEPKSFRQRRPDPNNPGKWIWNLDGVDRVLFNLPSIMAGIKKGMKVFVVEGEKDVESLAKIGILATTNAGGAAKWFPKFNDILSQTTVFIIPDNDEPGRKHADMVHNALKNSYIINLPGLKEHGDVSDWIESGGTREQLISLVREAIAAKKENETSINTDMPFIPMGGAAGKYWFLSKRVKRIVNMTTSSMRSRAAFYELAPLAYWEVKYPGRMTWDIDTAADDLLRISSETGEFDPSIRRGRGAWLDRGRTVLHQGNHLIVDGVKTGLFDLDSRYVYESAAPMHIPYGSPISTQSGSRFVSLINTLAWDKPIYATLFSGWLALSPICGALAWRPHLWLTGVSGSGKSWIMTNIVGGILGDFAKHYQSVTSAAGIRQAMGSDARPVVFDEAEAEDRRSLSNMQSILDLMRQASSESHGEIVKGSQGGVAQSFCVRSSFLLSSIGVTAHRYADESRITVVSINRRNDSEAFDKLQNETSTLLTPSFRSGFIARSCAMAKTIRENSVVFAVEVGKALGSRRLGDQIGALLAGHWSLWSDDLITKEEARRYIKEQDLTTVVPDESHTDENRCLSHLLEQRIKYEYQSSIVERTIGEIIQYALNNSLTAETTLMRYGIKVDSIGMLVSTSHHGIKKLFEGTQWETNWSRFLNRIDGCRAFELPVRYNGSQTRATLVPWKVIDQSSEQSMAEDEDEVLF